MELDFEKLYPFWNDISDKHKELIKSSVELFHFPAGDIVEAKDATTKNGLIILLNGFLRLYLSDNGREITISELRPGDAFCILTIDDAKPTDAMPNLQAREDTTFAYLNIGVLDILASESRVIGEFLFNTAVASAQHILNSVSHHFFNSIRSCLAKFIVDNAGSSDADCCTIKVTHEELANNLGTSRVVVSRELEYFDDIGLIKTGRGKIDVYNIEELKQIAGY